MERRYVLGTIYAIKNGKKLNKKHPKRKRKLSFFMILNIAQNQ